MGSIHKYVAKGNGKSSWRASYYKPDGKATSKRGFRTKREAEAFLATVEVSKLQGSYIAPSDSQVTINELGKVWLANHETSVKPSTFHSDESAWRIHVQPKWGLRKVGTLRHSEIATWISELSRVKSPTTVKRVHGVLAAILDRAVRDNRLSSNPAREVKTPRKVSKSRDYLSVVQVEELANEARYPDVVRFLAYTGLRWGEATGLRVKHVDLERRRVDVQENAVEVNGHVKIGTPKTHERRSVPYPKFLDKAMRAACTSKAGSDLLFASETGTHLRPGNAESGWFASAVKRLRKADPQFPRVTPHDLRHTAASLAISAKANVKVVQRMLGHASAAMTLDRYADLFPDDLDSVAEALDTLHTTKLEEAKKAAGDKGDKILTIKQL